MQKVMQTVSSINIGKEVGEKVKEFAAFFLPQFLNGNLADAVNAQSVLLTPFPEILVEICLNREIRKCTRVGGTFPDGNSTMVLVCARLHHVAGPQWGNKKYMNMKYLKAILGDFSIA